MDATHDRLVDEIRYAERLCQRTARLYRHLQTTCTFMSVMGGGSVVSSAAPWAQQWPWLALAGTVTLAVFGALNLSIRPETKAAANEADAKRYAQLRTTASTMTSEQLGLALQKARETDTAEVETLRDVAYNDLAIEIGRPDAVVPLSFRQRLLSAMA